MALGADQFPLRLVLHNETGHGACRDRVGAGQIHLSRTTAAREVSILSADDDLVRPCRDARSSVNASTATGFNHDCACLVEDIKIALLDTVVTGVLRTELNIELA